MFKWIGRIFRARHPDDVKQNASHGNLTRRALTEDEQQLLGLIQQSWGPQNTVADVFFMDQPGTEGAWIFAKDSDGLKQRGINLTNISAWFRDGTYSSEDVADEIGSPS